MLKLKSRGREYLPKDRKGLHLPNDLLSGDERLGLHTFRQTSLIKPCQTQKAISVSLCKRRKSTSKSTIWGQHGSMSNLKDVWITYCPLPVQHFAFLLYNNIDQHHIEMSNEILLFNPLGFHRIV